ncbi:potassium channel family protein [Bacillus sp. B1-b2]|uniref:potassium channel family protein n=1 Tax=Bacillus sp. B1-b2 TaxID=2653201 RepID=UPI00126292FB|nr:TrkA family potassium uptake protein [Bacillus sp. B1-b2]KAB7668804.1 TrkA family potassium uptake protein [Bacillus sp. B1-b2]
MKKQFVVIGLGNFGGSLVEEFYKMGADVLAIDQYKERADRYQKLATFSIQMAPITEAALTQVGIRNFDHAFVSMGEDVESSILTTMLLKEMGMKKVWVKAADIYHKRVLEKIGADRVIHPEQDMAKRIAHHVFSKTMIDYIHLSKEHGIVEIIASPKINNRSILDLDVRANFGCTIIGILRNGNTIVSPSANEIIYEGDVLIVIGSNKCLFKFEEKISS